jgi:hypothetical protein
MSKTALLVIALGIAAAGFAMWWKAPELTGRPTAQGISIQELHSLAHQESLPVQQFEDDSFVFTAQEGVKK